jgi:hypothetical protein
MTKHPGAVRALIVFFLCVILAGCQFKKKAPAEQAVAPAEAAATTQAPDQPADVPQASAPIESVAAPITASPGGVIASTDGEFPGLRVEINELKRDGTGTVTMKLTIVNGSTERSSVGYNYGDPAKSAKDHATLGGIHLLDNVNKQKYDVMRDAEDNCVCSREIKDLPAGGQARLWAKFSAPADGVNAVTVVVPHYIPMENVPLSQ